MHVKLWTAKALICLITLISVGLFSFSFVYAKSFEVKGRVRDSDGNDVPHAIVTATCGGITKITEAAGNGFYTFNFSEDQCPGEDEIIVTAESEGSEGSNSGNSSGTFVVLDIVLWAPVAIPEFGAVAGVITGAVSIGSYFLLKKKARL